MTSPAKTPPPLNSSLAVVTAAAIQELDPLWVLKPAELRPALFDVLPALVDKWGMAAASVAADWYDELRDAAAVAGRFTAIVPPLDNLGAEALAGWGTDALKAEPVTLDSPTVTAQSRVEGGLQKRLVNAANLTVTESTVQDPAARGYMRRTRPQACKFCLMVASRGGVYTKASATFACHERCYCEAVPAWGGQAMPVSPYKPSARPQTAADKARVRKWIKDNL